MSPLERNNVRISGKGDKTIVFAHGFGCDQSVWRFVAPAFEDEYQVVLFDYVGAGGSDVSCYDAERYQSLRQYAEDVLDLCDALALRDAVFIGHSVSATIGILAAIKSPIYFSRLVLLAPSPCYINDGDCLGGFERKDIDSLLDFLDDNYLGWTRAMAPVIMGRPDQPELGEELIESFCRMEPTIAKQFARVTFLSDHRADLPKLATPSLILQCSNDAIAPENVGRYLQASLPSNSFVQMKACGHCPHLSAPQETIEIIRHYLCRREP